MSYRRQTRGEIIIYHSSVGSECISFFFFRYLSRVVLVPFAYQPPSVSADTLDELLRKACAALPQAIVIGSTLMGLSNSYTMASESLHDIPEVVNCTAEGISCNAQKPWYN